MEMYKDFARQIHKELDYLMQCCDNIYDDTDGDYGCENCPLCKHCLRDRSIEDIWNEVSIERLADFIEYSDDVESSKCSPYASKEAWEDYEANESRQDY